MLPSCDQVRVHVIEARKLIGGQLNAIVKIVCGGDIKDSAPKKGSNSPFWDQVRGEEEEEEGRRRRGGEGGEGGGGGGRGEEEGEGRRRRERGRGKGEEKGEGRRCFTNIVTSLQMLYFHFKDRPQAVFDKVLEIKVLNAKVVMKDALIGSFKVSRDWGGGGGGGVGLFIHSSSTLLPPSVGRWYGV